MLTASVMSTISANASFLISLGIVGIIFLVAFVIVPYFKKKNILTQENIEAYKQFMGIVGMVFQNLQMSEKTRNQADIIVRFSETAVNYVEQVMKAENNDEKKLAAEETAIKLIQKAGIEVDEDLRDLIRIAIESAVAKLPKTNKTDIEEEKPMSDAEKLMMFE